MTEKQELNRKLAEWAGFEFRAESGFGKCWVDPIEYRHWRLPNFAESLDACFKWLVPKLDTLVQVEFGKDWDGYFAVIGYADEDTIVSANAETPSLALCQAIEKLIVK